MKNRLQQWPREIAGLLALALILMVGTAFWAGQADRPAAAGGNDEGYEVGDKVEDFRLKNVDGNMMSLSDFKDAKGFIVIFSCNHCPFVKRYQDKMIQLDKRFKDRGYPVVAINPNDAEEYPADSYQNMKKRANKEGFTFPYLRDKGADVARRFGASATPEAYVLQKQGGELVLKYHGGIDNNPKNPAEADKEYLANAVEALLKGQAPQPAQTKAIGCSIKYPS
jgi:peroxiredoxin